VRWRRTVLGGWTLGAIARTVGGQVGKRRGGIRNPFLATGSCLKGTGFMARSPYRKIRGRRNRAIRTLCWCDLRRQGSLIYYRWSNKGPRWTSLTAQNICAKLLIDCLGASRCPAIPVRAQKRDPVPNNHRNREKRRANMSQAVRCVLATHRTACESGHPDSNRGPHGPKPCTLASCAMPRTHLDYSANVCACQRLALAPTVRYNCQRTILTEYTEHS
jgi:hypothetical protein